MSKMIRGFRVVDAYKKYHPVIPRRATPGSAGYDLTSVQTVKLPKIDDNPDRKPTMVHTGIKVYMQKNEVFYIFNRSSNPVKRGLFLTNGVGVVDSDYYDSTQNGGELMVALLNERHQDYTIHAGDRVAQGVFMPFLLADDDRPVHVKRSGGFGSTGK